MYKLNFIAVVTIVTAVSLVVGMASPLAFGVQHENMTTTMDNMTSGGNLTTSMAETENITTAGQTGLNCLNTGRDVPIEEGCSGR